MSRPSCIIAPSMLSSDFACLASEAAMIVEAGADWLHMDIMDGHFVPNLTIGSPVIGALRKHTKAFLDCHMMVSKPEQWVLDMSKAGASQYTFHIEATENPSELIDFILKSNMLAAIAVKPNTDLSRVRPLLADGRVSMVLIMTVEPGFGGQAFMPSCLPKVRELRRDFPMLNIQVDGGIGAGNIKDAADAGANVIVAGSSVFNVADRSQIISLLKKAVTDALAHNN